MTRRPGFAWRLADRIVSPLWHIRTAASVASREEKWRRYVATFPPRRGERVLDVGVSPLDDLPGTNYFLRRYPYPDQLTAVGIDDLSPLATRYPAVRLVTADGRSLPFADAEFDVVHSNAVLEHVGPAADQERFVHELVRVARAGFITTPNRWFPFEVHASLPFVHWLPRPLAERALRGDEGEWDLWLLSARRLRALFPPRADVTIVRQRILGWPATLTAIFRNGV